MRMILGVSGEKADLSSDSITQEWRFRDLLLRLFRLLWVVGDGESE
jgi:hypothetical protein